MATAKLSLKVLACEIVQRELNFLAAQSPHLLDIDYLPVGHHDDPRLGHRDLQSRVDAVPAQSYDAILVGFGICSLMLEGLKAGLTPLVIPRAHDCITWFLGSKERYQQVFAACPGTYFFTTGWLEFPQRRAVDRGDLNTFREATDEIGQQVAAFGLDKSYAELVAKYGEENARYLLEVTQSWAENYHRGTLISFDCTASLGTREKVESICRKRGWQFEEMAGDLGLLQRWLSGPWDDQRFLIVQPGQSVHPSHNEQVIEARPAPGS